LTLQQLETLPCFASRKVSVYNFSSRQAFIAMLVKDAKTVFTREKQGLEEEAQNDLIFPIKY